MKVINLAIVSLLVGCMKAPVPKVEDTVVVDHFFYGKCEVTLFSCEKINTCYVCQSLPIYKCEKELEDGTTKKQGVMGSMRVELPVYKFFNFCSPDKSPSY